MAQQLNLLTIGNQRWREGRESFTPPRETLRTSEYEVAEIPGDTEPKEFIATHHYLKAYCAARRRFGFYHHAELQGIAVYGHPANNHSGVNLFGGNHLNSIELKRLCLLDCVPYNGESFFVNQTFNLLKKTDKRLRGVIAYADPMRRFTLDGRQVTPGHVGSVYGALSGIFTGRTRARKIRLLPDATTLNERLIQKIKQRQPGWVAGVQLLCSYGADAPSKTEDMSAWLDRWMRELTREYAHPGCFRWSFPLKQAARKKLGESLPYPKEDFDLYIPDERELKAA